MSHQIHCNTDIDLKEEALQSPMVQLQSIFGTVPFEFVRNPW